MGDRASYSRPNKSEMNKKSLKSQPSSNIKKNKMVIDVNDISEIAGISYIPKQNETKQVYSMFVDIVQKEIGYDHSREILWGSADEILITLKDKKLSDKAKKSEILNLLGNIDDESYSALVNLSMKITDFDYDNVNTGDDVEIDDTYGINVRFDSENESSEEDLNEKISEKSDEDENSDNSDASDEKEPEKKAEKDDGDEKGGKSQEKLSGLNLNEIDAFWLQRKISSAYTDPNVAQLKAVKVLSILETAKDAREIENRLITELGYQLFDLIKLLRQHRYLIFYRIQMVSASINDRQKIKDEIMQSDNPEIRKVLEILNKDTDILSTTKSKSKAQPSRPSENIEDSSKKSSNLNYRNLKELDLEDMAFMQGSLLMSNKKCTLGHGSIRHQHKGYEEVYIPAQKPPAYEKDEKLITIQNIPKYMQPAFEGYQALNRIQSKIFEKATTSDENLLICAPTGAGKTNVALLCMLREIGKNMESNGTLNKQDFKIIYIAPMKSLATEMANSFGKRLEQYGIKVRELTGDHNLLTKEINETQILVCTPEKWDIISRKGDEKAFSSIVSLIIFDEIHLLHDERGPVIESLIMRMQKNNEYGQKIPRCIGLSATLPNYEDVCLFLNVNPKTGLFHFDNRFRPVPLDQTFIGLTDKKAVKNLQKINEIVIEKVIEENGQNQILIFVHSRSETGRTARAIRDALLEQEKLHLLMSNDSTISEILKSEAEQVSNQSLKDILPYGIGIHHAGMAKVDRTLVEDLFADHSLKVLVSTSTLAWGVNLPAHTVIIKGTTIYSPEKGQWVELGLMDIMQMLGRAGRPQYDSKGNGILITSHAQLLYYLSIMTEQLPVESQLISRLPDCLNAEIALKNVKNLDDAAEWLKYSYLYIRILRNPHLYGISYDEIKKHSNIRPTLQNIAHTALSKLEKAGLLKYDRKTGIVQPTLLSKIASYFYCHYKSIEQYAKMLKIYSSEIDLCRIFPQSKEFSQIGVRDEEKLELQKLVERVPIPLKESIDEPSAKINILLQVYISQVKLDGYALVTDMAYVVQNGARLFRAIFETALDKKWANVAFKALNMSKCINHRMWASMTPLRQFKKIPDEIIKKIEARNMPWEVVCQYSPEEIGNILRMPKEGRDIHKYINFVPRLDINASYKPISRTTVQIQLRIVADFNWNENFHGSAQIFWLFIVDQDGDYILHSQKFLLKRQNCNEEHFMSIHVYLGDPIPPQYFLKCISDTWMGQDIEMAIDFHNMIPPEKFLPPTELLDLQAIPVSNLVKTEYEDMYRNQFQFFNSIQTQCFAQLYSGDDSMLICAPKGSGKLICAEIAILRYFNLEESAQFPVIFICPMADICKQVYSNWKSKFAPLDKVVSILGGDFNVDLKLIESSNIIITDAKNWDSISRRWKQKKLLQAINMYILYGLEYLNSDAGSILEIIGSRIRYIAHQTEQKIRTIGLGYSIANAKDVGNWIGVSQNQVFNFHPRSRPIPLEIHVQLFDQLNYRSRISSMIRSSFKNIIDHSKQRPCLVFSSSKQITLSIAYNYVAILVNMKEKTGFFLGITTKELEKYQNALRDHYLKELTAYGIGVVHESMSNNDLSIISSLYTSGAIRLCIISHEMVYKVSLKSYMTLILGLQYYNGEINDHSTYELNDIIYMVGTANRPMHDQSSKALLFCHPVHYDYYKKFIQEPIYIESQLSANLANHFNAEIVTRTVENKQVIDFEKKLKA